MLEARNLGRSPNQRIFSTFGGTNSVQGRQMARFVPRESYDAQNAAGGSANVYGDGRSCRLQMQRHAA